MKYGYFDDHNKEYVITDPKTPYPWINYLGSQSFCTNFQYRRRILLLPGCAAAQDYPLSVQQCACRRWRALFYINDSGDVWSPSWKPVKKSSAFMNAATGWAIPIAGARNGVR